MISISRSNPTVCGRNGTTARVVADSINSKGNRLTTMELVYPRFVHAEFMTHRMLSKNSASSRAIPVSKMIELVCERPAVPLFWGRNCRGMQSHLVNATMVQLEKDVSAEEAWLRGRDSAVQLASAFANAGYHKQNVNRLLEPFKMIKVVCTATEYQNFFELRRHADAQHDIRELADTMFIAMDTSVPQNCEYRNQCHFHAPYVTDDVLADCALYLKEDKEDKEDGADGADQDNNDELVALALKVSASCCAQVSYRTVDTSVAKALKIYDQLVGSEPKHASPFEHQARPMTLDDTTLQTLALTHWDRDGNAWSGNFCGWAQMRHLL